MKNYIKIIGLLVLTASVFSLSFSAIVHAGPISNPTHFDDTYWDWPASPGGYTSMDTDITPLVDGSPDGYYFSAYYWFSGDYPATGGYLGLQTEGSVPTGKIAIFSIWGAVSSSGPGYNASGNEGGIYYTSRISYQWVTSHTYDLKIVLTSQSGGDNTWTAWVTDTNTSVRSLIGSIVVPSGRGNLYAISSTFHERYSGATVACSDMQESEVQFTNLTANGGSVGPSSHASYPATGTGCSGDFATEYIPGGIETIIGGQFPPTTPVAQPSSPTISPVAKPKATTTSTSPPQSPTTSQPSKGPSPTLTTKPAAKSPVTLNSTKAKASMSIESVAAYTGGIGLSVIALLFSWLLFRHFLMSRRFASNNTFDHDLRSQPTRPIDTTQDYQTTLNPQQTLLNQFSPPTVIKPTQLQVPPDQENQTK